MNNDTRQRDPGKDRTNTEQYRRLVGILDRSETTCPAGVKPLAERLNQNRPAHPSTTTKPQGEVRHGNRTRAEKASSRGITLEDILSSENVADAWKRVRANKGAAGVDDMEVREFPDFYAKHWRTIHRKLMEGSYSPSPVRRKIIPKGKGQTRSLGIPTVLDRLIQQSIAQVLTPQYEAVFSDRSHGFRPRRSAHHAISQMYEEALQKGKKCHVVDCDLKAFFDTVDHQKLMGKLRESIVDPRVLKLILKYLKAGVILPKKYYEDTDEGVPQGGPLSPLLANILLDELDHELEKRGHQFVRYADDFVILCTSPRAGQRILTSVKSYLKKTLKLIVNEYQRSAG